MTNEELMVMILQDPENKQEIVDQLYRQVERFIYKKARELSRRTSASFDEIVCAMNYGFMEAVRLYNPNKGTKFTTYLALTIHGRADKDLFRRNKTQKRQADIVSMDNAVSSKDNEKITLNDLVGGEVFEETVAILDAINRYLESCPERHKQIITLYVFGDKSQPEISEIVGLSQNMVSRYYRKFRDYLRGELYGESVQ